MRRADRIIGASAAAFLIVLFFVKWYRGSASSSLGAAIDHSLNGWHSFHHSRWVWLLTIVVSLAAVASSAGVLRVGRRLPVSALVTVLGALSTVLVLYRIVHHPSGSSSGTFAGGSYSSSYGIEIGIWLALIAAAGITYGGALAMRDERASHGGRGHARETGGAP